MEERAQKFPYYTHLKVQVWSCTSHSKGTWTDPQFYHTPEVTTHWPWVETQKLPLCVLSSKIEHSLKIKNISKLLMLNRLTNYIAMLLFELFEKDFRRGV